LLGSNGNGIIDLQFAMYNYHSSLVATHSFASPWWSWPFMVNPTQGAYVPLWLEVADVVSPNIVKSTIAVFGNPAVWWVGFASVLAIALKLSSVEEFANKLGIKLKKIAKESGLWAKIRRKKPQNVSDVQNLENVPASVPLEEVPIPLGAVPDSAGELPSGEVAPEKIEAEKVEEKSQLKYAGMAGLGFLIFVLTAVLAENFNYHSFLLALPLYFGLLLAAYGMMSRLRGPIELKSIAPVFIVVVFFFSWLPYVFISRVTFMYHFYPSVPFLCLASAYLVNQYWHTKAGKIATVVFFVAVVALFVVFYPVTSGVPTSASYLDKLKWFPSWYW